MGTGTGMGTAKDTVVAQAVICVLRTCICTAIAVAAAVEGVAAEEVEEAGGSGTHTAGVITIEADDPLVQLLVWHICARPCHTQWDALLV